MSIKSGYTTNETVCVFDNNGGGKGNPKCAENRKIAVVRNQTGYENTVFDGIFGLGRIPQGSTYTNKTQVVAGLVNASNPESPLSQFVTYLDIKNRKLHLGEQDTSSRLNGSLNGFLTFKNQHNVVDDGQWGVRVEDVVYGIGLNNS